ncbi:hypothetical protein C8F01DRAFT_1364109 [Mycena amicta]|nr:hypothetical protein C8F01DRAFT_1364109 [Mycena amicta]
MKFSTTLVAITLFAIGIQAHDLPSRFAEQRRGNQFVTGPCKKDSDCQQGCCAFKTGKCAGPGIAQTRDGGCGFGSAHPNCNVAKALKLSECVAGAVNGDLSNAAIQSAAKFTANLDGLPFTPIKAKAKAPAAKKPAAKAKPKAKKPAAKPKAKPVSGSAKGQSVASLAAKQKSKKTVFETCTSDSQCQQGCCGFSSGKCAGPAVAQTNGSGGCGRGSAKPNCNVAFALGFGGQCTAGATHDIHAAGVQAASAFAAQLDGLKFTPS